MVNAMDALVHVLIFFIATGVVWYFAGLLVDSVSRLARKSCKTGFLTAFFVLGFLTSISEISVAVNASNAGVPGVSVGNLVGASFVLLLFVVPLLAVAGKGIRLNKAVTGWTLGILLVLVALPALLVMDGDATRTEGLLALLVYATAAYALYRHRAPIRACEIEETDRVGRFRGLASEALRIVIGALAIFVAAHFLVEQAVYFAGALNIPNSLVGLLLLSLGTNIPEIVIAIRSIFRRRTDIALGDYLGSAAMNTFIFGLLAFSSGTFFVEASEFIMTTALMVVGLFLLYLFARTKFTISRWEGALLLLFYVAFLAIQIYNVLRFATDTAI